MNSLLQKIYLINEFMKYNHNKKDKDYEQMVKHTELMISEIDKNMYVIPLGMLNKSDLFTINNSEVAKNIYYTNKEIWTSLYDLDIDLSTYSDVTSNFSEESNDIVIRTVGKEIATIVEISYFINTYLTALKENNINKWIMENFINSFDMFNKIYDNLNLVYLFDARLMLLMSDILRSDILSGLKSGDMLNDRFETLEYIYNKTFDTFYSAMKTLSIKKNQ